ncbi:MAG: hypothetical protein WD823_07585 [Sulfuricaulis sp.]|uniref:hypothetical protein n=1 Tax=Sulfuricaulis sp. TaxID=2003553 RepID=UPI0034A285AB
MTPEMKRKIALTFFLDTPVCDVMRDMSARRRNRTMPTGHALGIPTETFNPLSTSRAPAAGKGFLFSSTMETPA